MDWAIKETLQKKPYDVFFGTPCRILPEVYWCHQMKSSYVITYDVWWCCEFFLDAHIFHTHAQSHLLIGAPLLHKTVIYNESTKCNLQNVIGKNIRQKAILKILFMYNAQWCLQNDPPPNVTTPLNLIVSCVPVSILTISLVSNGCFYFWSTLDIFHSIECFWDFHCTHLHLMTTLKGKVILKMSTTWG